MATSRPKGPGRQGADGNAYTPDGRKIGLTDIVEQFLGMFGGALRGGTAALLGAPGEIEQLAKIRPGPDGGVQFPTDEPFLPDIKRVKGWLPGGGNEEYAKLAENVPLPSRPAAGAAALATGVGLGGDLAAIVPGRGGKLLPHHNFKLQETIQKGEPFRELYSPSIGITDTAGKGNELITSFGGYDAPAWLIPRIGAFSPKNQQAALFNRDSYTARHWQEAGKRVDNLQDAVFPVLQAQHRVADRGLALAPGLSGLFPGPPGTRMKELTPSEKSHVLAIEQSPRFQSFAHFEDSPYGAGALGTGKNVRMLGGALDVRLDQLRYNAMAQFDSGDPRAQEIFQLYGKSPSAFLARLANPETGMPESLRKEAIRLFKDARALPADYAELKVRGPVQVGPENFAGVGFKLSNGSQVDPNKLKQFLENRWGIEAVDLGSGQGRSSRSMAQTLLGLQESVPPKKTNEPAKFYQGLGARVTQPQQKLGTSAPDGVYKPEEPQNWMGAFNPAQSLPAKSPEIPDLTPENFNKAALHMVNDPGWQEDIKLNGQVLDNVIKDLEFEDNGFDGLDPHTLDNLTNLHTSLSLKKMGGQTLTPQETTWLDILEEQVMDPEDASDSVKKFANQLLIEADADAKALTPTQTVDKDLAEGDWIPEDEPFLGNPDFPIGHDDVFKAKAEAQWGSEAAKHVQYTPSKHIVEQLGPDFVGVPVTKENIAKLPPGVEDEIWESGVDLADFFSGAFNPSNVDAKIVQSIADKLFEVWTASENMLTPPETDVVFQLWQMAHATVHPNAVK